MTGIPGVRVTVAIDLPVVRTVPPFAGDLVTTDEGNRALWALRRNQQL